MRRRDFMMSLGVLVASQLPLCAQHRMSRVGVLLLGGAAVAANLKFATELARLGYVAGRNVAYDVRAADGNLERLPVLARELAATKPDVLIGASSLTAEALAAATADIPIVMTVMLDPIESGFSTSMSRPTRNVTGFTSSSPTLAAKRLQLLNELIPGLRRVAYVTSSSGAIATAYEQYVRDAAQTMGITIHPIAFNSVPEVSAGFSAADRENVQAVLIGVHPNITRLSVHIINECLVRDLPSIHPWSFEVQAGALMSYGPPGIENHAGAARYVDRILKGAKVSELPFEEPTEIKLAINLRTARSLKIVVPQSLLGRADEVIE